MDQNHGAPETGGCELPDAGVLQFIESRLGRSVAGERGDRASYADFSASDRAGVRAIGAGEGGKEVYAILYAMYRVRMAPNVSAAIGFCNAVLSDAPDAPHPR